jgi:hypothetical protein
MHLLETGVARGVQPQRGCLCESADRQKRDRVGIKLPTLLQFAGRFISPPFQTKRSRCGQNPTPARHDLPK